jgi:hypothetical protein
MEGGAKMKRVALLFISFLLLLSFGCATRDYVRQQIEPLVDKISRLEAKETCDCNKAEAAAKRAEEAADRAENASRKAGKAFELQQRK